MAFAFGIPESQASAPPGVRLRRCLFCQHSHLLGDPIPCARGEEGITDGICCEAAEINMAALRRQRLERLAAAARDVVLGMRRLEEAVADV